MHSASEVQSRPKSSALTVDSHDPLEMGPELSLFMVSESQPLARVTTNDNNRGKRIQAHGRPLAILQLHTVRSRGDATHPL